jgi:hypothetical protein
MVRAFPFDPFALDISTNITKSDENAGIVACRFNFSDVGISANEEFSILFDKPDRTADRSSGLPVCFGADVSLVRRPG